MTLLFIYLGVALGVSFLCSMLEAVLLSISRTHIAVLVERGEAAGKRLMRMKDNLDEPLAAILTLNTFAHTLGAAGVGAQAAAIWGDKWVTVVSVVLTLLVLIFSEIIPKTIGAVHAKRLAPFTAITIVWLIRVFKVLVVACNWISRLFTRAGSHEPRVSREEVSNLARMAAEEGVIDQQEHAIVTNLVSLRDMSVREVMTPRRVVFTYPAEQTVAETLKNGPSKFARVPLVGSSLDEPKGVIHRRELYLADAEGRGEQRLLELARPLHAVPETASVQDVLYQFLQRHDHLFLVVDEYGGSAGIITLEDTIETILGMEIVDETDEAADMQDEARKRYASILRPDQTL
ncbi:MAG: CNNM domain-containing protein [Phycisphaerales bacterium]